MSKEQNRLEYERCKEKGLLHRIDIKLLKEYGTEEEIAAREPKAEEERKQPEDKPKEQSKPKKKK